MRAVSAFCPAIPTTQGQSTGSMAKKYSTNWISMAPGMSQGQKEERTEVSGFFSFIPTTQVRSMVSMAKRYSTD